MFITIHYTAYPSKPAAAHAWRAFRGFIGHHPDTMHFDHPRRRWTAKKDGRTFVWSKAFHSFESQYGAGVSEIKTS